MSFCNAPLVYTFGQMTTGDIFQIDGVLPAKPTRFTVYIQRGGDREPHEIAMCVDARFSYNADKRVVVLNHKLGSWGIEKRDAQSFPFVENSEFSMKITLKSDCFKVTINKYHVIEFDHRFRPMDQFDTLRIDGDVQFLKVAIQR